MTTTFPTPSPPLTLKGPLFLYDADCGVCTDTVLWLKRRGAGSAITFAPYQGQDALLERVRLTGEDCRKAAWLLEPRDKVVRLHRGAAAVNFALSRLTGSGGLIWRLLASLYPLPLVRQVQDLTYTWFAQNRHRFSRDGEVCPVDPPGERG